MKLGVLGGTFDPVHNAHIAMAEQARDALGLDEVLFVPAGIPATHFGERITPPEQRLAMLRLALEGRERLTVSDMEMNRPGTSYTVETLEELRRRGGPAAGLYFIMGSDSLLSFGQWRRPGRIMELCRLVVVPRLGYPVPDRAGLEAIVPGLGDNAVVLEKEVGSISASAVRELARQHRSIEDLVPAPVAGYMIENGVYSGGIE